MAQRPANPVPASLQGRQRDKDTTAVIYGGMGMKTKYTPGPWRIGRHLGSPSGVRLIHKDVGDKGQGVPIIEGVVSIEDARLIAAAPEQNAELVKVLRFLADLNGCEWIKGDDAGSVDMRQRAKALQSSVCAVIAKAEGR